MLYKNKSSVNTNMHPINSKTSHNILREIDFVDQRKVQRLKSSSKGDENIHIYAKPLNTSTSVNQKKSVNSQQNNSSSSLNKSQTEKSMEKEQKFVPLQPGRPISPFEQVISTTETVDNGVTTYLISKALSGPMLQFTSQMKQRYHAEPLKPIPQIPTAINGSLEPHLLGYSTLTHQGLYRQSNEDKICIYLQDQYKWFSIYDGHGGNTCSQFLKDFLHQNFLKSNWKKDIPTALRNSFYNAEQQWKKIGDNSGSCALVVFIYQNICYVANLGDSRAILTSQNNKKFYQITKDHKPSNRSQQERVIKAGGKIYQTTALTKRQRGDDQPAEFDMIIGPLRVFPGRLSITRTIGDLQAKDPHKNGVNGHDIVTCQPQITSFEIDKHDMIIMGSDGIWDRLENNWVSQKIQHMLSESQQARQNSSSQQDFNYSPQILSRITQLLVQQSMKRNSTDNISIITIHLNEKTQEQKKVLQSNLNNQNITIHMSKSKLNNSKGKFLNQGQSSFCNQQKILELKQKIKVINENVNKVSRSRE